MKRYSLYKQTHGIAGWKHGFHPFLLWLSLLAGFAAGALDVDTLAQGMVVVGPEPAPADVYAAEEFQGFFRNAAGIGLESGAEGSGGGPRVYIGAGAAPKRHGLHIDTTAMGPERFGIRISDEGIAIAGGSPRGTLYGVYHFAETFLGVRFLTAEHTYVPKLIDRSLPEGYWEYEPPFAYRWVFASEVNNHPAFMARMRNNGVDLGERLGGGSKRPLISHSVGQLVPVASYGAEHPEYFAEIDGERVLAVPDAPQGDPQVDPLNGEVARIAGDGVLRMLAEAPKLPVVSVSPNDNPYYCTCAACAAMIRRDGAPIAPHLTLVNRVAARVASDAPGGRVGTLAYWTLRSPPATVKPLPNVDIQYCTFEATGYYGLDDERSMVNGPVYRDLLAWRAATEHLYVWHYITNLRHVDLPYPNIESLGANIGLFAGAGVKGLFLQANGRCEGGEWADMKVYVASRLMWDPSLDGTELADEFISLHYGAAAEDVRGALRDLGEALRGTGREPDCWSSAVACGYTPAIAAAYEARLQRALAQAGTEGVRERVEKLVLGAYKARLVTAGPVAFADGRMRMAANEEVVAIRDRYDELAERTGMDRDHEFAPRAYFVNQFDWAREGTAVATRTVGPWQVRALPDGEGSVASLVYQPTGEEWLDPDHAWGPGLPAQRLEVALYSGVAGRALGSFAVHGRTGGLDLVGGGDDYQLTRQIGGEAWLEITERLLHVGSAPERYRVVATVPLDGGSPDSSIYVRNDTVWEPWQGEDALDSQATAVRTDAGRVVAWEPGNVESVKVTRGPGERFLAVTLTSPKITLAQGGVFPMRYRLGVR